MTNEQNLVAWFFELVKRWLCDVQSDVLGKNWTHSAVFRGSHRFAEHTSQV